MESYEEKLNNICLELKREFENYGGSSEHVNVANGNVLVFVDETWVGACTRDEDSQEPVRNAIVIEIAKNYSKFKALEKKYPEANYMVVNSDGTAFITESLGKALENRHGQGSYSGATGPTASSSSGPIFFLGQHQKPDHFDDYESRKVTNDPFNIDCNYVSSRRWLCFCLAKFGGYVQEKILIDTGSPKSYILEPLLKRYKITHQNKIEGDNPDKLYKDVIFIEIEDQLTEINVVPSNEEMDDIIMKVEKFNTATEEERSTYDKYARVRGINLLGTDFINDFVFIDDFQSRKMLLLKRFARARQVD